MIVTDDELIRDYKHYMNNILEHDRSRQPQIQADFDRAGSLRVRLELRGFYTDREKVYRDGREL